MERVITIIAMVLMLFINTAIAQSKPEALQRLEEYRGSVLKGRIEWSEVDYRDNADWRRGALMYKTSKFAENAVLLVDRGDENGVVIRDENGSADSDDCRTPTYRLRNEQGTWEKMDSDMQPLQPATLFEGGRLGAPDPRSFGVTSNGYFPDIHEAIWRDPHDAPTKWRYEESRDGDLDVVKISKGSEITTYWIDPNRGWSPVRVRSEFEKDGRWTESRSILKQVDGVWFPEAVQFYDSNHEKGKTPMSIVHIYEAEFNRPEQPRQLSLADIGVDVGTMVNVVAAGKPQRGGRWDGDNVIDVEEFTRRKLKEGPLFNREISTFKRRQAEKLLAELNEDINEDVVQNLDPVMLRKSVSRDPKQCESLWEAYTRKFIEKYKLNEEQTQKALAVLKDCQDRGKAHLDGHRDEFAKYDELLKKTGQGENPDLQAMRDKLVKPLDDIFEQRLVPRLDKIPTRAQRKVAGFGNPKMPDASPKP